MNFILIAINFILIAIHFLKMFINQTKSYFYIDIDERQFVLEKQISPKYSTENFNKILSFYGLNPNCYSNFLTKSWSKFLLICYLASFIRYAIAFFIDPVKNHHLCVYLGDFTLLFQSLRKYYIIILLFTCAFCCSTSYLFCHVPIKSTEWFELFKCLDGTRTPKSIGIRNKNIALKMLILTKLILKIISPLSFGFAAITILFCLYLFEKVQINDQLELIAFIIWFPLTGIGLFFISSTIFTSIFCFQLICFYCYITSKNYIQEMIELIINFKGK